MDYPEDVWKQIIQKRRYSYANVCDVIWTSLESGSAPV